MALKGLGGSLVSALGKAAGGGLGALSKAFDPGTYSGAVGRAAAALPQIIKGAGGYLGSTTPQGIATDIGRLIGRGVGAVANLPIGAGGLLGRAMAGAVRAPAVSTLGARPSPYIAERMAGSAPQWMGLPPSKLGDYGGGGDGGGGGGEAGGGLGPWGIVEEHRARVERIRREAQQRAAAQAGGSALQKLVSQYNRAYQEARAANEARYQQLLDIASRTTGQREIDLRRGYTEMGADISQRLARLGMAGTTIAPTMQMGVEREMQSALNRLADEMQQTKLGIIERREDIYPQSNVILQLAQMLGANPMGAPGIYGALGGMAL